MMKRTNRRGQKRVMMKRTKEKRVKEPYDEDDERELQAGQPL